MSDVAAMVADVLVQVAVATPVRRIFTYRAEDPRALEPGRRLVVPFGNRRAIGFSLGEAKAPPPGELKAILAVLDDGPIFPPDLLSLLRFAADYYLYPLGDALRTALPPELSRVKEVTERPPTPNRVELLLPPAEAEEAVRRAPKQAALLARLLAGVREVEELRAEAPDALTTLRAMESKGILRLLFEAPKEEAVFSAPPPERLSEAQSRALAAIEAASDRFQTFLLQGVTGSGKTEVYLRAIQGVRARGRGAVVLVPEIALTPQLAERFRARFGDEIAVLHSGMSERERSREHRRLLQGEATIALGARSAVFAPVRNLGIVVVDEEHDASFKQEESFRYHARDLAVVRAKMAGIPCVLGSATPSLESLENARRGKYQRLLLAERVDGRGLPKVEVLDLRKLSLDEEADEAKILSPRLLEELTATLDRREQAILFLNRRGHAPLVLCPTCGERASCPNCDVGLTYHRSSETLRCHYCDLRVRRWEQCPSCKEELLILGAGTERLEQSLKEKLPGARILRLDRDTAGSAARLREILRTFARREADILVGTQMLAKGHDFSGVTLVGVVLADVGLGLPDLRAGERTFQLLTQVAGRAGRGEAAGKVLVQTFHPEADPIVFASRHDPDGFARKEAERRKAFGYPPYRRMLAIRVEGADAGETQRAVQRLGELARRVSGQRATVLGPSPAPIARLRGKSRFQLLLLAPRASILRAIGEQLIERGPPLRHGIRVAFDMDPVTMM